MKNEKMTDEAVGKYCMVFLADCFFPVKVEMVDEKRRKIAFNILAGRGVPFASYCKVSKYDSEQSIVLYDGEAEVLEAWRNREAELKAECKKKGTKWTPSRLPKCYTNTSVPRRIKGMHKRMTKEQIRRLAEKMVKGIRRGRP